MANQTELLNVSDEMKLDKDRQNLCEELSAGELCSSSLDTTEELYSSSVPDTCGECVFAFEVTIKNMRMKIPFGEVMELFAERYFLLKCEMG